jgi:hypothetical protein
MNVALKKKAKLHALSNRVVQEVASLLSTNEALSLNPRNTQKKQTNKNFPALGPLCPNRGDSINIYLKQAIKSRQVNGEGNNLRKGREMDKGIVPLDSGFGEGLSG